MKIQYNNLYTHFILVTLKRFPFINETNRERIEKYITGIVNNKDSKLYAIYANSEHVHFVASRFPKISEESLLTSVAESSERFIIENKLCAGRFKWQDSAAAFRFQNRMWIEFVNTFLINLNIIVRSVSRRNMSLS
jgi:putative transposase